MSHLHIQQVQTESEYLESLPVLQQLRPTLTDEKMFLEQIYRQEKQGYKMLSARDQSQILGLAGYRVLENLIYGKFIYVDDLIVNNQARSAGVGSQLIDRLKQLAKQQNCQHLVLDTALNNALGQKFYFRNGFLTKCIGFCQAI